MNFRRFVKPVMIVSSPFALGYLILAPAFNHAKTGAQRQVCQSNLKQMALAYAQYFQDADRVSPPISSRNQGWADLLQPYAKTWAIFQCPAGAKPSKPRRTDYFYNARLANARHIKLTSQTILFGDGTDNSGANAHLSELPFDWKDDENSVERRHWFGSNYAFADGHVKMIWPEKVTIQSPLRGDADWEASFAVR